MKNLFNRIFGSSKKNNETVQTFDDLNTLEPVMEVDESIFVEALDEEKEVAQQHEEISVRRKTAFDALLERDHRANGYSEGNGSSASQYDRRIPGRYHYSVPNQGHPCCIKDLYAASLRGYWCYCRWCNALSAF